MPKRKAGEDDGDYTTDWLVISKQYRAKQGFKCEFCSVDLSNHTRLLHTHHKNGVKTDNHYSNLQALCIDCHKKQPSHGKMFVRHEDMQLITRLRQEQKKDNQGLGWDNIFNMADTGVHGVLHLCRSKKRPPPIVGYAIQDANGIVVAQLELAWPSTKFGVAISVNDLEIARSNGWKAFSMMEALEALDRR
ncbi:HNH endonuclease [Chromatium okenii]|jgi:hypothetical protein|uniref:HNH endonuclease n=1 Tax=Chromatium okenii TaxID=61644 RepID=UPI0011B04DA6|nr:HNH endonuclease [Chromatium okenii]